MENIERRGENVFVHPTAIIYPNVILHDNVFIGPNCIIGEPVSSYYKDRMNHQFEMTEIGENTILRANVIIYEGTKIGKNCQTGHHVTIREKSIIGEGSSIGTLGDLQKEVKIGNYVRLHSNVFLGEYTEIDDYAWLFPHVVVTNDKYPPMDNIKPCKIGKYAIVCANSLLLPGIKVGENSLVAAGSVVSKDVSDGDFVLGFPARVKGKAADILDENDNKVYPWQDNIKEFRGYPWQIKKKTLNLEN